MTAPVPLLEADGLARRHPNGESWLLDHCSLAVHPGQRVAVVGPSGSGKTLLLRALAWLDPLDGGEVRWQGRAIRHDGIPEYRCCAVYLHQRPALLEATVEAAVRRPFGLKVHRGRQFDRGRILGLLEGLGRDESFLDKQVADLSGGESQIVALLRALQLDPSLLLLDEPTAAIDAATTGTIEAWLDGWVADAPDARAYVWVTHDAAQADRVAGRKLEMQHGTLTDEQARA
jgi:putative ABC transport system ATP-binding protein